MNKKYLFGFFLVLFVTSTTAIPFIGNNLPSIDVDEDFIKEQFDDIQGENGKINLKSFWLFDITSDGEINPGDQVTYTETWRWGPNSDTCQEYPEGTVQAFWLEGPGLASGEEAYRNQGEKLLHLPCDGSYNEVNIQFNVPDKTGELEYEVRTAPTMPSLINPEEYSVQFDNEYHLDYETVEVVSSIPEPVSDFDYTGEEYVGEELTFSGDLSTGDLEEYHWYAGVNENMNKVGNNPTLDYTFNSPGTYLVELVVIDSRDRVSSKIEEITIEENLPDIDADIDVDSQVELGERVTLDARPSDGQDLSYDWEVETSSGTETYSGKISSHTFDSEPGTYRVSLEVEDSEGQTDSTSTRVEVTSEEPIINSIEASDSITLGETLTVRGEAEHPNNLDLEYSWDNGDTGQNADYTFSSTGQKTIELTVSDGFNEVSETKIIQVNNETVEEPPQDPSKSLSEKLNDFLDNIFGQWFSFAVTQPIDQSVDSGTQVSEDVSTSGNIEIDTDYSDGSVTYAYGQWTITRNDEIVKKGEWKELNNASYSHSFSNSFDEKGEYSYIVILAEAKSSYENGQWSEYQINRVDSSKHTFRVSEPDVTNPPDPSDSLGNWFSDIISRLIFW